MARESFKPVRGNAMQQLPPSADDLPEQITVDLDAKDGNFVVVDDTPEEDRGRPKAGDKPLEEQEEDLRGVSAKVQKRIDRIRFETHSERRAREAAERERDAAVELARNQQAEIERLRKSSETGAAALANSMKTEREAKLADAKRRMAQAQADGDGDAIAQATADIAAASAELVQIAARTPAPRTAEQSAQPQVQPQAPRVAPQLKPNVAAWLAHNDRWFNKDKARTTLAMSIHQTLMERGVKDDSPEYTQELDNGLKAVYPEHVPYSTSPSGGTGGEDGERVTPRRTNVVTEGGREGAQGEPDPASRKVTLTQSEVSLANRLRVPLEKYAEEKRRRLIAEKGGAQ